MHTMSAHCECVNLCCITNLQVERCKEKMATASGNEAASLSTSKMAAEMLIDGLECALENGELDQQTYYDKMVVAYKLELAGYVHIDLGWPRS